MATCSDLARSNLRDLAILARGCGLEGGPHTYWQFYLPTAIGVSNYLHRLTNDPRRIDQAIGAVLFDRLRFAKLATAWRNTLAAALELALPRDLFSHFTKAAMQNLHDQALDVLDARSKHEGEQVLRAAARGIAGMHRVWLAADEEFSLQCAWAERVDHFRLVARRYMDLIDAERMAVDLETYDEPSSERSTTHVHDTDRLLVIEYGEMDFWNSFGAPLHLIPGDMLYVPRHRLHGSVVTSERCVYHQPVINTALVQAYDSRWN
jgi:mannose-6-phosphate isomerase-like protein (cupin superfamily)